MTVSESCDGCCAVLDWICCSCGAPPDCICYCCVPDCSHPVLTVAQPKEEQSLRPALTIAQPREEQSLRPATMRVVVSPLEARVVVLPFEIVVPN